MDYKDLFLSMHPDFFKTERIRNIPADDSYAEMVMDLKDFSVDVVKTECPDYITFGIYDGPMEQLLKAIDEVDDDWGQYYGKKNPAFCAFDRDRIVSFCLIEDMGTYNGLKIGGPGCVGTVPEYRKLGIGLKMVNLATLDLQRRGYDISYIHYTHVDRWYAKLGYKTVLRWGCNGFI